MLHLVGSWRDISAHHAHTDTTTSHLPSPVAPRSNPWSPRSDPVARGTILSSPRASRLRRSFCCSVGNVSKCSCATTTEPDTGATPAATDGCTSGQSAKQQPHSESREWSTSVSPVSSLRIDELRQLPFSEPMWSRRGQSHSSVDSVIVLQSMTCGHCGVVRKCSHI